MNIVQHLPSARPAVSLHAKSSSKKCPCRKCTHEYSHEHYEWSRNNICIHFMYRATRKLYPQLSRAHKCTHAYTCEYLVIAANMSEGWNVQTLVERDCLHSEMAQRRNEVLIQWTEGSCKDDTNRVNIGAELFVSSSLLSSLA